jgi:hypothetical protein
MPLDFGRFPAFLQDPFVPILATFTKDGEKPVEGVISAFVIEVLGIWYLMTAGHCITVIEENRARGYKATFVARPSRTAKKTQARLEARTVLRSLVAERPDKG